MTNWAKISTIPSCKSLIWFYFIEIIKYKKLLGKVGKLIIMSQDIAYVAQNL